jgi:hypothetical protein
MADESVENRDPGSGRSRQSPRDGESRQPDRSSDRRCIMIASLLAAPAVMTLKARSARAAGSCHPSTDTNYCGKPRKKTPVQTQSDRARH